MKRIQCVSAILVMVLVVTLPFGCTTTLSPKGGAVRVTDKPDDVKGCTCLGQVTSSKVRVNMASAEGNYESAMNDLKNQAAELGGNVLLTQVVSRTKGGTLLIGDAYRCPDPSGK